jgi:hypothetical protein
MLIWNIWKHYHHFVNRIFAICVKQFVMKSMILIVFYSGLLLFLSFISCALLSRSFFFICFPFILLHIGWQHSSSFCYVYYYYFLVILHMHTHSSSWLCTQIASTLCWNTVTVNYLSIFDDRSAVRYFMSKLRCCVIYER